MDNLLLVHEQKKKTTEPAIKNPIELREHQLFNAKAEDKEAAP